MPSSCLHAEVAVHPWFWLSHDVLLDLQAMAPKARQTVKLERLAAVGKATLKEPTPEDT